jgi:hypothetical protein
MKIRILTILILIVLFSNIALATRSYTVELREREPYSHVTDQVKCEKIADLIFIGTLKNSNSDYRNECIYGLD